MTLSQIALTGVEEICQVLSGINDTQAHDFVSEILRAKRIFLTGAGRSQLAVRGFAMRLMQIGLVSYMVGDTTTPSIREGDMLVVVSGSGETAGIVRTAQKAKALGAKVGLVSIVPGSSLGQLADVVMVLPAKSTKVAAADAAQTVHLGGSLFELSSMIALDFTVNLIVEAMGLKDPNTVLMSNHANLE